MNKYVSVLVLLLFTTLVLVSCGQKVIPPERSPLTSSFMLLDGEGPHARGSYSEELGVNTIPIYADDWAECEPTDNNWVWNMFPSNRSEYKHCILRIGVLHRLAWGPGDIPSWVSTTDLDGEFKTQYGEFVQAVINQVKQRNLSIDYYLVELEANAAGHEISGHSDITNAWLIDWIKWEVNLIKSIDTNARIIIPLTPQEFKEQTIDNTGDKGEILISDFVTRMIAAGVSFEAFGFSVASGAHDRLDDTSTLEATLNGWSAIDKNIFVWCLGYPADNIDNLPFERPKAGGYSPEWQKEQYVNSLRIFLNNPKVIGVSINLYDFKEPEWPTPDHWGLISGESTASTHSKRISFDAVKNYWFNNYP